MAAALVDIFCLVQFFEMNTKGELPESVEVLVHIQVRHGVSAQDVNNSLLQGS